MDKRNFNHQCIICGTRYHSCDSCSKINTYTPWRSICDTWDHYAVYLQIRAYRSGKDSKENVQAELKKLGVTKGSYADWTDGTKRILDEIFESPKKAKKVVEEPAVNKEASTAVESEITVSEIL